jgi:hypothetical protein
VTKATSIVPAVVTLSTKTTIDACWICELLIPNATRRLKSIWMSAVAPPPTFSVPRLPKFTPGVTDVT